MSQRGSKPMRVVGLAGRRARPRALVTAFRALRAVEERRAARQNVAIEKLGLQTPGDREE